MIDRNTLHSHASIERELKLPKDRVLVDERFGKKFGIYCNKKNLVTYDNERYYAVPIVRFVNLGGVFQN